MNKNTPHKYFVVGWRFSDGFNAHFNDDIICSEGQALIGNSYFSVLLSF